MTDGLFKFPRYRSAAEEPFLPQHEKDDEDNNKSPSAGPRLTRGRVFLIALAISSIVWLLLIFQPTSTSTSASNKTDPDSITSVEPTLLDYGEGNQKCTWKLPADLGGLLQPHVYGEMCRAARRASDAAAGHGRHVHHGYYWLDKHFLSPQVEDAVTLTGVCERSLTYMLDSSDQGLGRMLLGLWSAYGLAVSENRTFFVDDSRWAWGKYSTYFLPPKPACRSPPPNLVVPCPNQVPHLLVAHSTTTFTFGHAFTDFFEDGGKMRVQRQHKIFALARAGYESLFRLRLAGADEEAVEVRKKQLEGENGNGQILAVQIRRGDGKDKAFEWRETGHVPTSHYAHLVSTALASAVGNTTVLLTSDSADVYSLQEFGTYTPAQTSAPGYSRIPGGWNRVSFQALSANMTDAVVDLAREYFRDVKIVGETAGKVFCGGNGNTCRVLAVVMGWRKAVEEEGWVNVDDGRGWFGVDW
ncbi:hypothetical protein L873DRAFT_1837066 [Choiromyces venosus 120613-1]|uniref:Uncharacterized protein n=1 Tax=Choiromyces venosus 120613-1 TaxID=1336337 RepID=A0A3N4JBQ3_9PEZI|nr:hypothetical protein L873DRAFT_1837066 [Choiromyces venosus 120613-1]